MVPPVANRRAKSSVVTSGVALGGKGERPTTARGQKSPMVPVRLPPSVLRTLLPTKDEVDVARASYMLLSGGGTRLASERTFSSVPLSEGGTPPPWITCWRAEATTAAASL